MSTFIQYQGSTINATQTELFVGGTPGQRTLVGTDKSISFWGSLIAKDDVPSKSKHWRFAGLIKNQAGTTSLVELVDLIIIAGDAGASSWDIDWQADDTNDALALKVTGEAGTNISWEAKLYIIENG